METVTKESQNKYECYTFREGLSRKKLQGIIYNRGNNGGPKLCGAKSQ